MNRRRFLLLLCLLLLAFVLPVTAQEGDWPRTVIDGLGTEVTIEAPPQRIVSATLGSDEILLALIEPERIVAVTQLALDPAISNVAVAASQIENTIVTSGDTEYIISLQPDIVFVATFTEQEVVQQLRDAGLTVFSTPSPTGFEAIQESIRLLGQVVGEEEAADALAAEIDAELAEVAEAIGEPDDPVTALYLTPSNYTSGAGSTYYAIITAAGGVDVAGDTEPFVPISDEFIIEQNPDVILLSGWTPWDPTFVDGFVNNPAFADMSAIQNGRIYVTTESHISTVSQYVTEGVKDVAAYLYPELYPVFPVTVTDAAGREVTVDHAPEIAASWSAELDPLLEAFVETLPDDSPALDVVLSDEEAEFVDVAFTVEASDAAQAITLYDGDTPAETVANYLLLGDALGERVAALNAVAAYTRTLQAEVGA